MLTVACVKWGTLYGPEYANILFDAVRRNLPAGFSGRFVCFTDDPTGLDEGIETRALPRGIFGWFNKLALFTQNAFPQGERVLYFDLDTAITGPLDAIAAYRGPFAILRDAYRKDGLQSSVMAWEAGNWTQELWKVWEFWKRPTPAGGDQAWIEQVSRGMPKGFDQLRTDILQDLFPGKFRSYKGECRAAIPPGTSVVFFHGHPRPHEVVTGWVPEVWKVGGGSGAEIIARCNVAAEQLAGNVTSAIERKCPWAEAGNAPETAVIVAGGPSLAENLFYVRGMQKAGAKVYATGNSWAYLARHGIRADAHVLLDARPENVDFVPRETGPKYYASQCHPGVLTAAGEDLLCWHAAMTSYESLVATHPGMKVGGGTTVGLKAIALCYALGHRHLRLFGFDSCYSTDAHHAYPQPGNDGEKTLDYSVGGRTFRCAPWMIAQAEDFKAHLPLLVAAGCIVRIYGDGLIPHLASLMEGGELEIEGLWWPASDVEARPAVLGTLGDLDRYTGECRTHRTVIQAGGNVGVWPKALSARFSQVVTFEPDPINFSCLRKNVTESNVTAFHAALGEQPGSTGVRHDPANCGASHLEAGEEVRVRTIDSLEITDCDLLQLDVEGYELKALKGAQCTIERSSPVIVLELKGLGERYGDTDAQTIDWLTARGYSETGRAHRDIIFKRLP